MRAREKDEIDGEGEEWIEKVRKDKGINGAGMKETREKETVEGKRLQKAKTFLLKQTWQDI